MMIPGIDQDDHEVVVSEYLIIFVLLVSLAILLQYFVACSCMGSFFPEASITIIFGIAISGLIRSLGGYNIHSNDTDTIIGSKYAEFDANLLGLNTYVFYFILLPPIIFSSGYHMNLQNFFSNLRGIMYLAVFGTLSSILIIFGGIVIAQQYAPPSVQFGHLTVMEALAFASLMSSTDPVSTLSLFIHRHVETNLFYLVLGESLLNDAVSFTLYSVANKFTGAVVSPLDVLYIFIAFLASFAVSAVIGCAFSVLQVVLVKRFAERGEGAAAADSDGVKDLVLCSWLVTTVYVPFLLAEMFDLSGIVAVLTYGILSRRYMDRAADGSTLQQSSFIFKAISHLAETATFAFLGLSVFAQAFRSFQVLPIAYMLLLITLGRLHVYPLLCLANQTSYGIRPTLVASETMPPPTTQTLPLNGQTPIIPLKTMHMVFFAGIRGAVAYSCANIFTDRNGARDIVLSTTTAIVVVTIVVQGGLTDMVLVALNITRNGSVVVTQNDAEDKIGLEDTHKGEADCCSSNAFVRMVQRVEENCIIPLVTKNNTVVSTIESDNF